MLTTPVDLLFSLSFLFSIWPFPFRALGPELFFSLALPGEGLWLGLSLSLQGAGSCRGGGGEAGGGGLELSGALSACGEGGGGGPFFRLLPEVGAAGAAGEVVVEWWCCGCGASSSGLLRAEVDEDRVTEWEVGRPFPLESPRSWPLLLLLLAAKGAPVDAAMSPNILALIFSRFAFHSSRKSVAAFDLNPPVAIITYLTKICVFSA